MDAKQRIFIDTNILIRATIPNAPNYQEIEGAMQKLWEQSETELWISRQILREYASGLTRPQTYTPPISASTIGEALEKFEAQFQIAEDNATTSANLRQLMRTIALGGKQIHDANIVATMQVYQITHIFTLNIADFERFKDIIAIIGVADI